MISSAPAICMWGGSSMAIGGELLSLTGSEGGEAKGGGWVESPHINWGQIQLFAELHGNLCHCFKLSMTFCSNHIGGIGKLIYLVWERVGLETPMPRDHYPSGMRSEISLPQNARAHTHTHGIKVTKGDISRFHLGSRAEKAIRILQTAKLFLWNHSIPSIWTL